MENARSAVNPDHRRPLTWTAESQRAAFAVVYEVECVAVPRSRPTPEVGRRIAVVHESRNLESSVPGLPADPHRLLYEALRVPAYLEGRRGGSGETEQAEPRTRTATALRRSRNGRNRQPVSGSAEYVGDHRRARLDTEVAGRHDTGGVFSAPAGSSWQKRQR